jgi:bacterioferritin-associated ferredoxin
MSGVETLNQPAKLVSLDSQYICQCFRVTEAELLKRAREINSYDFDELRRYYDVGSRCTSCEVEIRDVLHEFSNERVTDAPSKRVPLIPRIKARIRPWRGTARFLARKALMVPRRFEVFAVKDERIESELVLSNLAFPDDVRNANGPRVRFDIILRNDAGKSVAHRTNLRLGSNESRVYSLAEIWPGISDRFVGTVAVNFYGLRETGSLRPYCRLRYHMAESTALGSCHYHDQFTRRPHYQHVIVTHPMLRGETCWLGLSNPVDSTYRSRAFLQAGDKRLEATVEIPPLGALWGTVPDLFGRDRVSSLTGSNSVFWLESESPLMAWFFWHNPQFNAWSVQHK